MRSLLVWPVREDWHEKRQIAEEQSRVEHGRCLVIPFQVFGFGPYAEVLGNLEYESDGRGLLPHEAVLIWMRKQADALSKGPFEPVLEPMGTPISASQKTDTSKVMTH